MKTILEIDNLSIDIFSDGTPFITLTDQEDLTSSLFRLELDADTVHKIVEAFNDLATSKELSGKFPNIYDISDR